MNCQITKHHYFYFLAWSTILQNPFRCSFHLRHHPWIGRQIFHRPHLRSTRISFLSSLAQYYAFDHLHYHGSMPEEDLLGRVLIFRHFSIKSVQKASKLIDSKKQKINLQMQVFENACFQKSISFASLNPQLDTACCSCQLETLWNRSLKIAIECLYHFSVEIGSIATDDT